MSYQNLPLQELLGLLNEVEQKNAPKTLYVAGDTGILAEGARVAIVGSCKASPEGLRRGVEARRSLGRARRRDRQWARREEFFDALPARIAARLDGNIPF